MARPLFSASYSARLERKNSDTENAALMQWNHQLGVPKVFGDIWGSYVEVLRQDDAYATPQDSDDEATTTATAQDRDKQSDHDAQSQGARSSDSHGRTIGTQQSDETTHSLIPRQPLSMANKTRWWISLWFIVSIPVIFWDAGYCFMRPRSMKGGDLHWIWQPYALYQEIDFVYGLRAFENKEGFTNAQSFLNVVENFMNIGYLYLAHIQDSPVAPLLGFASVVMTLSKTILYWLQEYYCGACSIGHNDLYTLVLYWVIPNGLWLLVPGLIIAAFAGDIAAALFAVDRANKVAAGKKRQ